jgi:hypothetical protein
VLQLGSGVAAGSSLATEVYFSRGAAATAGLTEIECELRFDRDVLGQTSVNGSNGWNAVVVAEGSNTLDIRCTRSSTTDIASGDVLFSVEHRVTVSHALESEVQLARVSLMPGVSSYTDCVLTAEVDSSALRVPLLYDCADSLFVRYLSGEPVLSELDLSPAPASDLVHMKYRAAASGQCQLTLLDLNGRPVTRRILTTVIGPNACALNVRDVPSGSYTVSIESLGYRVSTPLIVRH